MSVIDYNSVDEKKLRRFIDKFESYDYEVSDIRKYTLYLSKVGVPLKVINSAVRFNDINTLNDFLREVENKKSGKKNYTGLIVGAIGLAAIGMAILSKKDK
jgi:hypothetical protein